MNQMLPFQLDYCLFLSFPQTICDHHNAESEGCFCAWNQKRASSVIFSPYEDRIASIVSLF